MIKNKINSKLQTFRTDRMLLKLLPCLIQTGLTLENAILVGMQRLVMEGTGARAKSNRASPSQQLETTVVSLFLALILLIQPQLARFWPMQRML